MKTVVVGCGHIANVHIPRILKTDNIQLVGLYDQNELRTCDLANQHNIPYYTNLTKMLVETRPDALHVLTPPQTHAALAIQGLEAGCHVLVEKPLCLTLKEADAIYATAQSAGRLVSVDHSLLWSSLVQRAQRELASGRFGRVLHIQYMMSDDYLEAAKKGYRRWALELRGGVFCDLIPHSLYLIRAFLPGARVVSARACGTSINDLSELWADFAAESGGANLYISLKQRPLEHNLRLFCERGTIYVDLRNFHLAVVPERGLPGPVARVVNTLSESRQRGMGTLASAIGLLCGWFDPQACIAGSIRAFYQAILGHKASPVSPAEARAVVELSKEIWDILEGKRGAIRLATDKKGKVIFSKTPADFAKGAMNKSSNVLVTGGTGFIGSHLVKRLVAEGKTVRVLCRESSVLNSLPTSGVELSFGDVSELDSVHRAMKGIKILYHLAATMGGDWASHYQGTVVGTRNVLEAAAQARIKKVVYVSSLGVLHASFFPNGGPVDESFPVEKRPAVRGYYSRAKLEAEDVAREFMETGKLSVCIVRPGLVYGPGRSEFLSDAGFRISNRLALIVGMGGRRLSLTYVKNMVDALVLAERCGDSCGKTYHIVDPDQPTVRQYIKAYKRATCQRLTAIYMPTFLWKIGLSFVDGYLRLMRGVSPNLSYRLRSIAKDPYYDISAALRDLGWQPKFDFEDSMCRTFSEV